MGRHRTPPPFVLPGSLNSREIKIADGLTPELEREQLFYFTAHTGRNCEIRAYFGIAEKRTWRR